MKRLCLYICLFISLSVWGCQENTSTSNNISQPSPQETLTQETMNNSTTQPPDTVINAVFNKIEQTADISQNQLQIQETKAEIWPNGCLGLEKPDELCTQALVEGWRIVVSDGNQNWVYRTDQTGQMIRQES